MSETRLGTIANATAGVDLAEKLFELNLRGKSEEPIYVTCEFRNCVDLTVLMALTPQIIDTPGLPIGDDYFDVPQYLQASDSKHAKRRSKKIQNDPRQAIHDAEKVTQVIMPLLEVSTVV